MSITPVNIPVSIIIPFHNRVDWLPETLEGLATLSGRPLEVVLVDNGSTDASLALCEAFKARLDRPDFKVLLCSEPQPGANKARNTGFHASNGAYVWFFDSDDKLYPDSLTRLLEAIRSSEAPDLLVFPYTIRDRMHQLHRRPHRFSAHPADHLIDPVLATHNMCLKRSLVEAIGGWHPELARWQDFEFGFRALLASETVTWLKGWPFYEVRDHASSISGRRFIDDLPLLEKSLMAIQRTIDTVDDPVLKDRLSRACGFKWASLAGLVRNEGHPKEALHLLEAAFGCLGPVEESAKKGRDYLAKKLYRFTAWYGGLGGRGSWRLGNLLH